MSQYFAKLRDRDGIRWPQLGAWSQGEDITRLAIFAGNLEVSSSHHGTVQLNSIPVPWARLLLFESALHNPHHPAHHEITAQWRGLLGVLALAQPLGLKVSTPPIVLPQFANTSVARAFIGMRPNYVVGIVDQESGKWDEFQLLKVDDKVIGATSPRTLLFTGVESQCPSSIPFRSPDGRLIDPVPYYRQFNDLRRLGLLMGWLQYLVQTLQQDPLLTNWLGQQPAAAGANPRTRASLLIDRLNEWMREFGDIPPINLLGVRLLSLHPYDGVLSLREDNDEDARKSDFFLAGHNDVVVCYCPENGSWICDGRGQKLLGEPLNVYSGHWVKANDPLPLPMTYLPLDVRLLRDPAALFEENLIQVELPKKADAVYYLEHEGKRYLFPFKQGTLAYLSPEELAVQTHLSGDEKKLTVELTLPLVNNRSIKVTRSYPTSDKVISSKITETIGAWPDFASPNWKRYFYVKQERGKDQISFEPIFQMGGYQAGQPYSARLNEIPFTWFSTEQPVEGFIGNYGEARGLLLLKHKKHKKPDPPTQNWRAAVDFGSTHTRAFAQSVVKTGNGYQAEGDIQAIRFKPRAQLLTYGESGKFQENFMALVEENLGDDPTSGQYEQEELKTLLMRPVTGPPLPNWLPSEGIVFTHSPLAATSLDSLRSNLKWNANREDLDLRAFLRNLLVMLQAEAFTAGARITSIAHSYPSVFTEAVRDKHNDEWLELEKYLKRTGEAIEIVAEAITETVAVCCYLESAGATPANNTLSLDVGGSTTDIAVWADGKLVCQESVKLAAGIVNSYLKTPAAKNFFTWLQDIVKNGPYNCPFEMERFQGRHDILFNSILSVVEGKNLMGNFIKRVKSTSAKEAQVLLSHIIFLFSGLLYYSGLLARKAGFVGKFQDCKIYFCGRGGTLIKWIPEYSELAEQFFLAGLSGPTPATPNAPPNIDVELSPKPKEEVGRGLLSDSTLDDKITKKKASRLQTGRLPTITVGETGYAGFNWDGDLTYETLKCLTKADIPPFAGMVELNHFKQALQTIEPEVAKSLGITQLDPHKFEANLTQRFLGGDPRKSIITGLQKNPNEALLEPLFITELKVLLETSTNNPDLFS